MEGKPANVPAAALGSLISPLEEVPEDKFRRVVSMLEGIRHKPEIKAALDGMRARIVQVKPPRHPTVQRVLYLPIEDALVNVADKEGCGYVSRAVMAAAWTYLERETDQALLQGWQREINALSDERPDEEHALEDRIWRWAAESLKTAAAKALVDRADRKALLGDSADLLGEMQQCIRLLEVGTQIRTIKKLLPLKPVRVLEKENRAPIRHLILDLRPPDTDQIYAILFTVMLRLAVPGEFLEDVPAILSGFPTPAKAELQARLTVFVMGDMDRRAATAIGSRDGDLNLRAKRAELLVAALSAGEKTITTNDRDTRKQLVSVRGTAEKLVNDIVREADEQARGGIAAENTADRSVLKRAEDSVSALRQCTGFADRIGLDESVRGTMGGVTTAIREQAALALDALRGRSDSAASFQAQCDQVYWTVRMLELSGNADEADTIRRTAVGLLAQNRARK